MICDMHKELVDFEERGLIGTMIDGSVLVDSVASIVSGRDFFDPDLGQIFDIIKGMSAAGDPITLPSIVSKLKVAGIWERLGASEIAKMTQFSVPHKAVEHAKNIFAWAAVRRLKFDLQRAIDMLDGQRPDLELDDIQSELRKSLENSRSPRGLEFITAAHAMKIARDAAADVLKNGKAIGTPTGFDAIDSRCGGFVPGELTTLAASTGFGKTAFSMEVVARVAEAGLNPVVFSFEMAEIQVGQRYLSRATSVPVSMMKTGDGLRESDIPAFDRAIECKAMQNIDMVLACSLRIEQVCNAVRWYASRKRVDLLVIDYIGKVRKRIEHDERAHATDVVRNLKDLALSLRIPILLLCQLNRAGEGNKPTLTNLADSSTIERDSDMVWALHGERGTREVTLDILKARQAKVGAIALEFDSGKMKWSEPVPENYEASFGNYN